MRTIAFFSSAQIRCLEFWARGTRDNRDLRGSCQPVRQKLTRRWALTKLLPVTSVTDNSPNFPVIEACGTGSVLLFLPLFSIVGISTTSKAFSHSLLITKPLTGFSFLLPQQKSPFLHSDTNLQFSLKLARLIFLSHCSDSITSLSYRLTYCIKSTLLA